jgi:hypothetical protein
MAKLSVATGLPEFSYIKDLTAYEFNPGIADSLLRYLERMDKECSKISNAASDRRDRFFNIAENSVKLKKWENEYYNQKLEEIVTKPYEKNKYLIYNNKIIQNIDPVYLDPSNKGFLSFRTHFYAPSKNIFGIKADTFVFNISVVLLSTILLYLTLYFELLGKAVRFFENFKFRK